MSSPVVVSRIQNRRGTQDQFESLYPPGYNGTGGCSILDYPNILMPGELALCTDSRRMFIGNVNGEYVEIAAAFTEGIFLAPFVVTLPPSVTYQPVPGFHYTATPFFTLLYNVTDSLSPDWNTVGSSYSRNGSMRITATTNFAPIPNPPFPPITSVSVVDDGVDVNLLPSTISFIADYDGPEIVLLYKHDFPGSLTFSSSTIRWLPF